MDVKTLSIVVEIKNGDASIRQLGQVASGGHDAEKSLESLAHGAEQLKKTLEALGVALGAIELFKLANEAREAFEDFERLGAVVAQVGAVHGIAAEEIVKTESALRAQGASMQEARADALALINAHIDLASASKLLGVAQDIAAITGDNETESMHKVVLAIQTGMDRSLKHAGITLDLAKAVDHAAASMGGSADQMSQAQKEQVRLNAVLETGAQIAGAHAAALETDGGAAKQAQRELSTLKTIAGSVFATAVEGAAKDFLKLLVDIDEWAKKNPEDLVKVADGIKAIAIAVGAGVTAFVLMKTAAAAASSAVGIFAAIETLTAFVELARSVETAADAFALLELVTEAITNPAAIIASIAAITAGLVAWHYATKDVKEQTEKLGESLNGLHPAITKVATETKPLQEGLSSSAEALRRLALMKENLGPLLAELKAVAEAYAQSAGQGELAEKQAKLNDQIRDLTKGLVGTDKQLATHIAIEENAGRVAVDHAKKLREVTDATDANVRNSAFQVTQALSLGAAVEKNNIAYEHSNAIIAANQLALAGYAAAAAKARQAADDAQRNALAAVDIRAMKAPWMDLLSGIDQGIQQFAFDLATRPADAFKDLANTIRQLWGQLIADLAKMEFEKKILPGLAGAFGIDASGSGADVTGAASAGPIGIAALGLGAAAVSLIEAAQAQRVAAKQFEASTKSINDAILKLGNPSATLGSSISDVHTQAEALRQSIHDTIVVGIKGGKDPVDILRQATQEMITLSDAEAARIQQLIDEDHALRATFANDLEIRRLRALGLTAEADAMQAAIDNGNQLTDAIKKFGAGSAEVAALVAEQNFEIQQAATNASAKAFNDAFFARMADQAAHEYDAQNLAAAQARAQQQILQDSLDTDKAQLDVVTKQLDLQQKTVDGLRATVDALRKQSDSLNLSALSPLSANDRYQEAKRQYDILAGQVAGGDQSKIGDFTAAQTAFLTESRAMFGDSGRYVQDFKQAQLLDATLGDHFQAQLTTEEKSLAVLQGMQNSLNYQISLMTAQLAQLIAMNKTYVVGSTSDPNFLRENGLAGPADTIYFAGTPNPVASNGTSMAAYTAWMTKHSASGYEADWGTTYDQWVARGAPSFANGTSFFGGGKRVVGERGPELEFTGPSRILPLSQISNQGVVDAINGLRAELRDRTAQENQKMDEQTKAIKSRVELAGSRR